MALAITALIATSVAGMMYSVTQGTRNGQELRRRNVKAEVVTARLESAVRGSRQVLAAGPSWAVLWTSDARANQKPNVSELLRIEFDAAGKQLRAYAAPATLAPADDVEYAADADFDSVTNSLKGTGRLTGTTWAARVAGWTVSPIGASPGASRLLCHTITFEDGAGTAAVTSAVALRGQ